MPDDHMLERVMRQNAVIKKLIEERAQMRGALMLIREWQLPYVGFSLDNGSNGERDYFRGIANDGLHARKN